MNPIDWIVLFGYVAILATLTILVRRAQNMEDFSVASRGLPTPIIFATMAATYIGPGYSMGLVGKAASQGYIWFFVFCAFSLQTLIFGVFFAPQIQKFKTARTVGDILGKHYGHSTKFVAGILTIALLTGFIGVMVKASADIISMLTDLPFLWAAILSAIAVVSYSTFGGIKADITNDTFQFILLSVGIPLLLILVIRHEGFDTLIERIPQSATSAKTFSLPVLIGLFLSFFLGEALIPPYTVRALAAQDPCDAQKGFVFAAFFSVIWFFICVNLGVFVSAITPNELESRIFIYAMQSFLPHGLYALVLCAMVAIILSSWDSLLNCASTAFQTDVFALVMPKMQQERKAIVVTKIANVLIGIGATVFALSVPSLVEALLYCYTLWAPTVVLPLAIAILKQDVCPSAGLIAIVCGGVATGLWEWAFQQPYQIPSVAVGLLANQIAFWCTHFVIKRTSSSSVTRP